MAHYGTLRDFSFPAAEAADDIRGSTLYGRDNEKLGRIEDVIFDHASGEIRYLIVDAGGWLKSKKFIVPPQQLRSSTTHKNDFSVDFSKEQIENFPAYDEGAIASDESWRDYEGRYQESWISHPILHREGSDRSITPTAREMPAEPGSIGSQISREQNQALTAERIVPAGADVVAISSSASGIGGRWSTFEDRLRTRRKDIIDRCVTCAAQQPVEPGRKAG
ncbi:MAG: PRC-barrel domain-containing protein [Acidobacteriales bacterium]|nr:PRC-barrel domain-containing protein [Terriglobales bacterium]